MLSAQVLPKALITSQAHFYRAAFVRGLRVGRRQVLSIPSISGGGTCVWCSRLACLSNLMKESLKPVLLITGDSGPVRLVLIGDVHHQWDEQDVTALKHLQPDIALFVGDFGEEVVELSSSRWMLTIFQQRISLAIMMHGEHSCAADLRASAAIAVVFITWLATDHVAVQSWIPWPTMCQDCSFKI